MAHPKPDSLYIHVPFCRHICPYCDFAKVIYRPDWSVAYLEALEKELQSRGAGLFATVYLGGGTPTCLQPPELDRLLSLASAHLAIGGEFSIEANPDSLTQEKVDLLKRYGVNRVSLGAQSSTAKSLQTLGRSHDFADVERAVTMLRQAGITNLNLDWMYGFPKQTLEDVEKDIEAFLSLDVPHLSCYSLILEEGTAYAANHVEKPDDDIQQDLFDRIKEALQERGYHRYEISNFAKDGYQCAHNKTYWKDLPYMGAGLGAAGYEQGIRYKNTRSLSRYLEGKWRDEEEAEDEASALEYYFLTNLRLSEGFSLTDFQERFGLDFLDRYGEQTQKLIDRGLLILNEGRACPSPRGMDLLDTILLELF